MSARANLETAPSAFTPKDPMDQAPKNTIDLKTAAIAGSMFATFALVGLGLVNPFAAAVGVGAGLMLSHELDANYDKQEKMAQAFAKAQIELEKIGFIDPRAAIDKTGVLIHAKYKEPIKEDMAPLFAQIQTVIDLFTSISPTKETVTRYEDCDLLLYFKV